MSLEPCFGQDDSAQDPAAALRALLVVSPDGQIQFATERAHLWIRDFLTITAPFDRLPEALIRWLNDEISGGLLSRFIVDLPGKRLCIQLLSREAHSVCLLLEENPDFSARDGGLCALTERQTEVLCWVARGKSNEEIGKILSLKTGTIAKSLERIFLKLHVENRTAAASFAPGTNTDS